jgi:hypothetical protein
MTRNVWNRSQHLARELAPPRDERCEQPPVGIAVLAQVCCGFFDGSPCEDGRAVVERVSEGGRRLDQVELELQEPKERRGDERRVDRRADVVPKSREGQLSTACSAADGLLSLDEADGAAGLGKRDRSGEAVGPCPYYDCV